MASTLSRLSEASATCWMRSGQLSSPLHLDSPLFSGSREAMSFGEAELHIGLEQSLVRFVDLLVRDDFEVGGDVTCPLPSRRSRAAHPGRAGTVCRSQ